VTNGTGEGTYDAQTGKLTVTKCGTFTVKVSTAATDTYAAGAETTATLTVNKADSTAASVTANTLTYTGSAQALVTVTGEATGGTMQYALGTKDAATEEYTTSIPTATNAGTYYVYYKVIGDDNHEDSQPVCITVMIAPAYAVITKDPSDAKVIRGSRVTFRIAATGENVTYRWETSKDNGETWVKSNADGADTDKIVFKATESLDGRLYRCVAITDAGKVFSASAQLTTLPVISSQPRNAAATIGSVASFTVKARSSVAKYQWQVSLDGGATWKKSGSEGAETATLNVTVNGAKYNGYLFRCKVTNGTWTEYSKEVKLSVKTAIVKQPEDVSEYYGNLVKLYVKATGVNPQYQWQVKNASGKWVNSTSAGNNTNILAFTSRASLDGRQFRCKITDENGTLYSNIITFTAVEK
jgi:VCBS repeat-containing protein